METEVEGQPVLFVNILIRVPQFYLQHSYYFLCLYHTGNFNIIIKNSSFILLYISFTPVCILLESFFSHFSDFCHENVTLDCEFRFKAYAKNVRENANKMLLKNWWVSTGCWWTYVKLSLKFIKVQWLQVALRGRHYFYRPTCPGFKKN